MHSSGSTSYSSVFIGLLGPHEENELILINHLLTSLLLLSPWFLRSLSRDFNCWTRVQAFRQVVGYSFAFRTMTEKRSLTMLAMIYQKDQAFQWVLLESPNFLISSSFTLGTVPHYNRTRARVSSFVCTGSEAVYLCWEVGWVEINKECLCQYFCEQSSRHLAVNWGGDSGLSEVVKYEPLRFSCFPWSCAPLLLLWKLTGPGSGLIFPSPTIATSSPLYLPIDFNRIQMLVPPTQPFIVSEDPRMTGR